MKLSLLKSLTILVLISITLAVNAQKQALIIGTFHFDNPGMDAVKTNTFDVLTPKAQNELAHIANQIGLFKPTKVFLEWDYREQKGLDSLYQLYLEDKYDAYVETNFKGKKDYESHKRNEIVQLGFRAAKKAGLKKVHAIDYQMSLPFDTVMKVITSAGQTSLMDEINKVTLQMGKEANAKISKWTLTEMLLDYNTTAHRTTNNGLYIKYFNRAGLAGNFAGADGVTAWYKRNLYMYSMIQKLTQADDQKIMVLLGSGHVSMIKKFIDDEQLFTPVELKDVLNKK